MIHARLLFRSFAHAARGLVTVFRSEQNFRIQLSVALFVFIAMFALKTTRAEKVALVVVAAGVLVLELLNSVLERFIDLVKPRLHDYAREIKDLMAAAVLLTSIVSVIVGVLILYPYVLDVILH